MKRDTWTMTEKNQPYHWGAGMAAGPKGYGQHLPTHPAMLHQCMREAHAAAHGYRRLSSVSEPEHDFKRHGVPRIFASCPVRELRARLLIVVSKRTVLSKSGQEALQRVQLKVLSQDLRLRS